MRRLLTSPGLWGLNEALDRKKPQTPRVNKAIRRGIKEDVLTVIENQAARLGDLSIGNKQQAANQIDRLSGLIFLISNRTDPRPGR